MSTERPRPPRGWLRRLLLGAVVCSLVATSAVLLALRSETGRGYLARGLSRLVSDLLVGEIHIGSVRELSGAWVVLGDVECRDAAGKLVVRARRVEALLNLGALLDGALIIEKAKVDTAWVSLHWHGDQLAIAEIFLPVSSGPSKPSPAGAKPFYFAIRQAILRHAEAVEIPAGFSAARVEARGELSYSEGFRMRLSSVRGQVAHRLGVQAELRVKTAALRVVERESSNLEAELDVGPEALHVQLSTLWGEHGPARGHAALHGTLSAAGLSAAGLSSAAPLLRENLQLHAGMRWDDARKDLELTLGLDSAGAQLSFEATRVGALRHARLRSNELNLARVLTIDELPALAFDLELQATPNAAGSWAAALHAHRLRYADQELPAWTARANLSADGAHLFALEVPRWQALRGKVDVDIQADYTGDVHGSLAAQLPKVSARSALGRLSHARSAELRVAARGSYRASSDELRASGTLQVSRLLLAGASIAELSARLEANGKLRRPALLAQASARGLTFGKLHIDRAEAEAKGGPVRYAVKARAAAGKAHASADLALTLSPAEQRLSGTAQLAGWFPELVVLTLGEVRVRPEAIELRDVRASAGVSLLALEGRYGRTLDSDLHLRVENLALGIPTGGRPSADTRRAGLFGRANAHLHLTGRSEHPVLDASLHVVDLSLDGGDLGVLALDAALDSRRGEASARLSLTSPEGDGAQLQLTSQLAKKGSLWTRLEQAHFELAAQGKQDLQNLSALWQAHAIEPSPSGRIAFSARVTGRLEEPEGELSVSGTALTLAHVGPLDAALKTTLGNTNSQLSLALTDYHGPLATLSAEVQSTPAELVESLQKGTWRKLSASYRLKLEERKLAELPPPLQRALPFRVALQAELNTATHEAPRALLSGEVSYEENDPTPSCPDATLPRLRVSAQLDEERLAATLSADLGDARVLDAQLSGRAPDLAALSLAHVERDLTLTLKAHDIDLARLPGSCGAVSGRVGLSLEGQGLLSPKPVLNAQVEAKGFHLASAPPVDVSLRARADRDGLQLSSADVQLATRRALHAEGRLPWRWDGAAALEPDLAHCSARAQLSDLPLATLLAAVSGIAQPAGSLDGNLTLNGCGEPFDARGQLTVKQAAFTLKDPLMRVDGLWASLRLRPDALELDSFKLADQDGLLTGKGRIDIVRGRATRATLTFKARSYPLRADANIVAYVDGKIAVAASLNQNPRRVRVGLSELSVSLPTRRAREAQALAPHADIIYVNAPTQAEPASPILEPQIPLDLEIDAQQPFWVRREDFGLQLATRLRLQASPLGVRVSGRVGVQRGFINMLSKGFDIERGELLFDGGEKIDPTVTIDAVHKLSDGQTVTVRIRDRVSAPVVTFATSVAGVTSDAEILQMLVRGRDASAAQTAQAQVGAALAGLTAGLLGSLTRTSFGKYVPVLSIEAGASSGTRMRAGVEANALIPRRLRNVIEGAYVEGFVGSRNQGGNAQATGGVLMELYFPKKVVTGGTWELPNNWSVEATWEP